MAIDKLITDAEEAFKESLEKFFLGVYPEGQLISHGIEHHRRVWQYAKELLNYVYNEKQLPDELFVSKLFLACYLHDIGMSVERGERHGWKSRMICEEFLAGHSLKLKDYEDALHAIEHHDNKDFMGSPVESEILSILTAADDLDAFGIFGAERYLEIYRLRGIPENEIKTRILSNARNRFMNFELNFGAYPILVGEHKKRYDLLVRYFNNNPV